MLAEMKFSDDPWQLVRIVIAALFVGVPLLLAAMWLVLLFSR
jgi:hypothetical protein